MLRSICGRLISLDCIPQPDSEVTMWNTFFTFLIVIGVGICAEELTRISRHLRGK